MTLPIRLPTKQVGKAVLSVIPGLATCHSGLHAQHLNEGLQAKASQQAVALEGALTDFINLLASGDIPD